jgi:hypothetical protein
MSHDKITTHAGRKPGPAGIRRTLLAPDAISRGLVRMTAHAEDMVLVSRAGLHALWAENRRLRREAGDREALKRIRSDSGEGRTFTREGLAEAWGISMVTTVNTDK